MRASAASSEGYLRGERPESLRSVSIQPVTDEIAESLGLAAAEGALIASVTEGGPAEQAGLKTGDVVLAFGGAPIEDLRDLTRAVAALENVGGAMILTADHGNCELMLDPETGGPHTAHTLNPVPVALIGGPEGVGLRKGRLADLAPTLLQLMGLQQPDEMTGESLIVS